jgi:hypothetical protein
MLLLLPLLIMLPLGTMKAASLRIGGDYQRRIAALFLDYVHQTFYNPLHSSLDRF